MTVPRPDWRRAYVGLFGEVRLSPQQDLVKSKSLSEVYSMQTFRKEFEKLPPFSSKKLKLTAMEGFLLQARDIVPTGEKAAGEQLAGLDCQGAH
jgi:hypothetical protein